MCARCCGNSKAEAMAGDGVRNGVSCEVVAGSHAGKAGIIEDRNTSKTGHVTITVRQAKGERFKTLARNVVIAAS